MGHGWAHTAVSLSVFPCHGLVAYEVGGLGPSAIRVRINHRDEVRKSSRPRCLVYIKQEGRIAAVELKLVYENQVDFNEPFKRPFRRLHLVKEFLRWADLLRNFCLRTSFLSASTTTSSSQVVRPGHVSAASRVAPCFCGYRCSVTRRAIPSNYLAGLLPVDTNVLLQTRREIMTEPSTREHIYRYNSYIYI